MIRRVDVAWALVPLGLGACSTPKEVPADATPDTPRAAATATTTPTFDPLMHGWAPRVHYDYRVDVKSVLDFGSGGQKPITFEIAGGLVVVPVAVTATTATLFVAFHDVAPDTASRGGGGVVALEKVHDELRGGGCFFDLQGGRFAAMHLRRAMTSEAANVYREIASALQFVRTADASGAYSTKEYDAAGRYAVDYQVDPASDGRVWSKKKTRYESLLTKGSPVDLPLHVIPQLSSADWTIRLSSDGRPEAVAQRDEIRMTSGQMPVHGVTTISLEAQAPAAGTPDPDWNALLSSTIRVAADEPYGPPVAVDALDDARIHGLTFEKVVREFERLATAKDTSSDAGVAAAGDPAGNKELKETSIFFEALSAIFRRHPETVGLAMGRIQRKSPAAPMLIAALGTASSAPAQTALVTLINSKTIDSDLRRRATLALVRTPRPDQASADSLIEELKGADFDETALYGLGTFSRRMRDDGQPDASKALGELIVSRLDLAKTTADTIVVLGAIANSGYVGALPRVSRYLDDESEIVRSAAVGALQSMHDPSVDLLVAMRLAGDESSKVRISAIDAARVRSPSDTLTRALARTAIDAQDPRVRYRAVELMSAWLGSRPDLRPTLERVAKSDAEPRVRDRAQAAL